MKDISIDRAAISARLERQKAMKSAEKFVTADAIVERAHEGNGKGLLEITRNAVIAAMVAVTAATAIAAPSPAKASPQAPVSAVLADTYFSDVNRSIASVGDLQRTDGITGLHLDVSANRRQATYAEVPYRHGVHLLARGGSCVIHHFPGAVRHWDGLDGFTHLDLGEGANLDSFYVTKAITECLVVAHGSKGRPDNMEQWLATGATQLLAYAKYDKQAYEDALILMTAQALATATVSSHYKREASLLFLEVAGSIHDYFKSNPAAFDHLRNTDVSRLPGLSDAFVGPAMLAASRHAVPPGALYQVDGATASEVLAKGGLKGASHAATIGSASGLVRPDLCAHLEATNSLWHSKEGLRTCPLRSFRYETKATQESLTERYGTDVAAYLNAALPTLSQKPATAAP